MLVVVAPVGRMEMGPMVLQGHPFMVVVVVVMVVVRLGVPRRARVVLVVITISGRVVGPVGQRAAVVLLGPMVVVGVALVVSSKMVGQVVAVRNGIQLTVPVA